MTASVTNPDDKFVKRKRYCRRYRSRATASDSFGVLWQRQTLLKSKRAGLRSVRDSAI